ncbi:MAG: hypothetical protein HOG24_03245 [Candidatus Cloacimonetes bacterium]|jgi:hypothetical protein|nr:hypothetical protein [Candidatus Cloacimonadota bacterium]
MKKLVILAYLVLATVSLFAQNVAVTDDNGYSADPSAMLDVNSTSKGFLVPRMTAAQRGDISSPATGLLVYQTDGTAGYYYNSGTPASPTWTLLSTAQLSLNQGQIYIGNSSGIATGRTVSGDVTINEVGTTTIGYYKVTNDMLDGSISSDKLAGGIYNDQLAGSISNDKLAGGITNNKLAGSITNDKLSSGPYMITDSGQSGQVWTSDGTNAGVWTSPGSRDNQKLQKTIEDLQNEIDKLKAELQAIKLLVQQIAKR